MRLTIGEFRSMKVVMIVSHKTEDRLSRTCFRPLSQPRAGNFRTWRSPRQVIERREMLPKFRKECLDALMDCVHGEEECFSFTIEDKDFVGWSRTDDLKKYPLDVLEITNLNRLTIALKVRKDAGRLAPATKSVTFVLDMKVHHEEYLLFIRSIYPGPDVGALMGDVSRREQVVFFDWNHEGEKIVVPHEHTDMGLTGH